MKNIVKQKTSFVITALLVICMSFIAKACEKSPDQGGSNPPVFPPPSDSARRILFIGNSLTYTNNLPGIVSRLAREKGIDVATETIALPNYALEDHWNDGRMQELIKSGRFEFVVVQQGPSSQQDGRVMLQDYGARIKAVCDDNDTKLAFFVVWPAFSNLHTFDGVIRNYTDAATATNSLLCPVGQEWQRHFSETGDYSYYGPDMFHPSEKGSIVAGEIIVRALFQ